MSAISEPAKRRRSLLFATSIIALSSPIAYAQTPPAALPPVEISPPTDQNKTRARPLDYDGSGAARPARTARPSRGAGTGTADGTSTRTGTGDGSGTGAGGRQFNGIVGASSSVITAEDIAHSPSYNLPDILGQVPGVQLTTLFGVPVNGAKTSVDLRGFGAFATSNTLILINGRRLNDVDMAQVDLSTIPLHSIERIEITRGNSGAVLYGDNAIGGVINIVLKNGVSGPPAAIRAEAGVGSFNTRLGNLSMSTNYGPWSSSFYGNAVKSDGYRDNNAYDQRNGVGNLNYTTPDLKAFLTVTGDDQKLGLAGGRTVDPTIGLNQLVTDRKGTNTPFDYGNQQGASATAGFTKTIMDGVDLIVDGGVRDKKTQAGFFGNAITIPFNYVDSHLQTWSITPRLSIKNNLLGVPSQILTGVDYYNADYHSDRPLFKGAQPIHVYDLSQQSLAGYWQHTIGVLPTTDFAYGARVQNTWLSARDHLNPFAPGTFGFETEALPLNSTETNYALHVGIEHRFTDVFSVFGRAAHAFRTPNVEERVASGPLLPLAPFPAPAQDFRLKTQTSHDVEGGIRIKTGQFQAQASIYNMDLENEIHFIPALFYNVNLDPTRRYGAEVNSSLRVSDTVTFRGGFAYTRAIFREGQFVGSDVPLVSRHTASAGVTWNIWQNYLVLDATLRAWSSRFMDNDQANLRSTIPGDATIDLKLSGAYQNFFWSFAVINVLDALYYDYAIQSSFTPGRFSAYPLPGRSFLLKAGVTF
jgi:iron complex outermembrane receptor protein